MNARDLTDALTFVWTKTWSGEGRAETKHFAAGLSPVSHKGFVYWVRDKKTGSVATHRRSLFRAAHKLISS